MNLKICVSLVCSTDQYPSLSPQQQQSSSRIDKCPPFPPSPLGGYLGQSLIHEQQQPAILHQAKTTRADRLLCNIFSVADPDPVPF
jgi:hypothetical protein